MFSLLESYLVKNLELFRTVRTSCTCSFNVKKGSGPRRASASSISL
uniref:Uncharacterized protein n=1 Tax=Lepeophtheirus salmonis TaxID=72036 RepID=A0A0K2VK18_LEPSM